MSCGKTEIRAILFIDRKHFNFSGTCHDTTTDSLRHSKTDTFHIDAINLKILHEYGRPEYRAAFTSSEEIMHPRHRVLIVLFTLAVFVAGFAALGRAAEKPFCIGIIGLDTSHSFAFASQINDPARNYGMKVVCAWPGGSPDIEMSATRIAEYTAQVRDSLKIEIVGSVEDLLKKVDGVLLESVDGRPHLELARKVIKGKKPLFVDKPAAGSLGDVIELFMTARQAGVPCWSSSSLRYSAGIAAARTSPEFGGIVGCDAFSPCSLEPHHPDLYWYGIHGVETLFTVMGPGCETVSRTQTKDTDYAVGVWKDGRIGTFRGIRSGKADYGAFVFGAKSIGSSGGYTGYGPLVEEIVKFFKTGKPPVSAEETIEIYAFMSAADESKKRGGAPVSIAEVVANALGKK